MPFTALQASAAADSGARGEPMELIERYRQIREQTEDLVAGLSAEDCCAQAEPDTHENADAAPKAVKWHLAESTACLEQLVLEPMVDGYSCFNPDFSALFNGTTAHPAGCTSRCLLSRPALDEIYSYRTHVDRAMLQLLQSAHVNADDIQSRTELCLQMEQSRQESILTDLKQLLADNPMHSVYRDTHQVPDSPVDLIQWLPFPEGLRQIGHDGRGFSFSNERPRHRVFVHAFELASRPVTNAEYLAFMEDGGYARQDLWLSDGWQAVQTNHWTAPSYWRQLDGEWHEFTLGGLKPLRMDQPVVHISWYEAQAYAAWAGARLPTEAEWEIAAERLPIDGNFVESAHYHPIPSPASRDDYPVDLFGNIWEWTQSAHAPYPGHTNLDNHPDGVSAKAMSNRYVMKGGSCATPENHLRASYRGYQRADARRRFCGLRLAR